MFFISIVLMNIYTMMMETRKGGEFRSATVAELNIR